MLRKLNYLNLDWSLKQEKLFPGVGPLIIEIGFGNGDYLIHLAQARPDHNIIGFEISSQSMDRAERKIERRGLQNARPIHSSAETALAHLLEPEMVKEFHINFPDPWFKKRHGRRRLIKQETVDLLSSRLQKDGTLLLVTDISDYAEMAHEILSRTAGLSNQFETAWVHELENRFQTKYELKAYREGRRAYFFKYRRNALPVTHPAIIEELEMPHLFLHSPLNAVEIVKVFSTLRQSSGGIHIAILHAYADPSRDTAVFEVVVQEPTIDQHTMILLAPRDAPAEYIVKMTSLGHARPTYGMHRAVEAVGEYVAGLHEEARVLETKLQS